jgi:hypothetical protein
LPDEALDQPAATSDAWLEARPEGDNVGASACARCWPPTIRPSRYWLLNTLPRVETADFASPPGAAVPTAVGPCRLLRELGQGGVASVWLAERTQREREILATLNHPHIATLFDAGVTDDGQPWLALQYVQGERLDEHCDHQNMGVPARLRLFLQVGVHSFSVQ